MRDRQTLLTSELLEYLENNFSAEDSFLADLVRNSWEYQGIPQINITGYQANFLQFLVKVINAQNILEIGTLAGYSAIVMARAAGENAHITTIEKETERFEYAIKKVKEAGLDKQITVINQNAREFVKTYNPQHPDKNLFDLIFVDADKSAYMKYLNALTPYLRKGGLFVSDNAFAFGFLLDSEPERDPNGVKSMLNFHKNLLIREDFFTTLVPIGDGMLVSVKIK